MHVSTDCVLYEILVKYLDNLKNKKLIDDFYLVLPDKFKDCNNKKDIYEVNPKNIFMTNKINQ